jgi:membrane protein DedA with SNARE-associated domain
MEAAINMAKQQAVEWTQAYGYHAVVPALLADPAGVPWAWIFLLLLSAQAGKSLVLLFLYGTLVVSLADHALYWLGRAGHHTLLPRLTARWPKLQKSFHEAEKSVRCNAPCTVVFGRYLPLVGRWVGVGAGLARIPYAKFAFYDAIGAAITTVGFGLVAYWVGEKTLDAPWFPQALLVAFVGGTLLTLAGVWLGARRKNQNKNRPASLAEAENAG